MEEQNLVTESTKKGGFLKYLIIIAVGAVLGFFGIKAFKKFKESRQPEIYEEENEETIEE